MTIENKVKVYDPTQIIASPILEIFNSGGVFSRANISRVHSLLIDIAKRNPPPAEWYNGEEPKPF